MGDVLLLLLRRGSLHLLKVHREADPMYQALSSRTKPLANCLALQAAEAEEVEGCNVDALAHYSRRALKPQVGT